MKPRLGVRRKYLVIKLSKLFITPLLHNALDPLLLSTFGLHVTRYRVPRSTHARYIYKQVHLGGTGGAGEEWWLGARTDSKLGPSGQRRAGTFHFTASVTSLKLRTNFTIDCASGTLQI